VILNPGKFENRPLGPTITLFFCFEQPTAEPLLPISNSHERLSLMWSLCRKAIDHADSTGLDLSADGVARLGLPGAKLPC
jgi:hypothetical protein